MTNTDSKQTAGELVKHWISTLQGESRVTDEDAEDLEMRIIAFAGRASVATEGDADQIQEVLDAAVNEVVWSTRPSASDYVILEGPRERILAFLDESNARQLVKRHNAALATFLATGTASAAAASSPAPAEPPQNIPVPHDTQRCPECRELICAWADCISHNAHKSHATTAEPVQPEGEQESIEQILRKKRARRIIDVVIGSPCIVETRFFSQPEEQEKLEDQIAVLLAQLEREQLENEIFQDATDPYFAATLNAPSAAAMRAAEEIYSLQERYGLQTTESVWMPTASEMATIITRHLATTSPVIAQEFATAEEFLDAYNKEAETKEREK